MGLVDSAQRPDDKDVGQPRKNPRSSMRRSSDGGLTLLDTAWGRSNPLCRGRERHGCRNVWLLVALPEPPLPAAHHALQLTLIRSFILAWYKGHTTNLCTRRLGVLHSQGLLPTFLMLKTSLSGGS